MAGTKLDRQLSIVVPAFNEERRIGATLTRLLEYGQERLARLEILVVDDGSRDRTRDVVLDVAHTQPAVKLLGYPDNRGKGAAVRTGMLAASLPLVLFSDADLSTPIEDVERLFAEIDRVEVAIGSRAVPGSQVEIHQPFYREWMGRSFNLLVQGAALPGIHDSQCGFKLFRRESARELFARAQLDGFAFDVEILFLCRRLGYQVAEVPVHWRNDTASKVHPVRDSLRMARDLLVIRATHR